MEPIIPMEPKRSEKIPAGDEWIAQIKWDGVRVLTYYDGQAVRLYNRKLNERTSHYPEITNIKTYCDAKSVILDGEIIALGPDGKPSFHEVMRRDGVRRTEKIARMKRVVPITYMIFDVIFYNGIWINSYSLSQRNQILSDIILPNNQIQLVSSHEDGQALFKVMKQYGMEGIIMKRLDSQYIIGKKKDIWLKIKNYRDLIAVIGGYTLSGGIINAVLLGLYDDQERFLYIGHTGTGKLSQKEWKTLTEVLKPLTLKERPFANKPERQTDVYWAKPIITVKVQYTEWTEGRSLRQPSLQAFVYVPPSECKFSKVQEA
ncbi:non-homologous end-joining DNA ligase [Effusibacillus lacus]|uniref:DNA ligase (ATP) n=1 Tax=Effusibacillus lacus TaxID=1348429 RepID=A0A292YND7_9BACL|nr:non-homologous end-joining DNA ligase [Effusibacillus lacus]TCS67950.1 bifunctional non-homologous end joining protein LigD [Effusibacillus lacus]GAX89904.1 DNA ligase [Effusibacillus lacus]